MPDFKDIAPKTPSTPYTASHVVSGVPIPKTARIRQLSSAEWEEFTEEWASSLKSTYLKVERWGGAGDKGIDVVGIVDNKGLNGVWDNYQCKHYQTALAPTDIWVEIGKVVYFSFNGDFYPPRKYYFICPQDIGTKLKNYLSNPDMLKTKLKINWAKYCETKITSTSNIPLDGELLKYFDDFDFSIFSSRSHVELIEGHSNTPFHSVRFGGGLRPRPPTENPPTEIQPSESRYIKQIYLAYSDHLSQKIENQADLNGHPNLGDDFLRQRERFYHAESLRNFARDSVPDGTFDSLQDEVYHGVIDKHNMPYQDGLARMHETLSQSASLAIESNPLLSVIKVQDRQGICHQLANRDKLTWVKHNDIK